MPSYFDPFIGYTPASNIPSYYNPYRNFSGARTAQSGPANQTAPGQQLGQRGIPGRDTPTPGSKHGAGRKVRIAHPRTGEIREIDAARAQHYVAKGGRIV